MSQFYIFAGDHPVLTFVLFWLACWVAVVAIQQPFRMWNRWLRHRNIAAHGWPTPPLDADGDVIRRKTGDAE